MTPDAAFAAVRALPSGQLLVVTVDALVAGVHFPERTAPADVGWKSLAVNLSDLAAMGAQPLAAQARCTAPAHDAAWIEQVHAGLRDCATGTGVTLTHVRGQGQRRVVVQALGQLPRGSQLTRGGARAGDALWVSGTLGDAGAALALLGGAAGAGTGADRSALGERLTRPQPRLALGRALRGLASAAIDVSDGLVGDAAHIAERSGVRIHVEVHLLPLSDPLLRVLGRRRARELALAAGDDYELLFTAPADRAAAIERAAHRAATRVSRIGQVRPGSGVTVADEHGEAVTARAAYQHFSDPGDDTR